MTGREAGPIGILGGGRMGSSIAALCLAHGYAVHLVTRDPPAARERVEGWLARYGEAEKGAGNRLDRLRCATGFEVLAACRTAIEAVSEDAALKRRVLAEAGRHLPERALLLSNTSTLGGEIASDLPAGRAERVAILHFFHPVFRMRLVELQPFPATSAGALAEAAAFARSLGREVIELPPGVPGGVVSRLLLAGINEAYRLAERPGLGRKAIDRAMQLGAHWPLGPFALTRLVGADVVRDNLAALWRRTGHPAFQPAPLLLREAGPDREGPAPLPGREEERER